MLVAQEHSLAIDADSTRKFVQTARLRLLSAARVSLVFPAVVAHQKDSMTACIERFRAEFLRLSRVSDGVSGECSELLGSPLYMAPAVTCELEQEETIMDANSDSRHGSDQASRRVCGLSFLGEEL